MSGRVERHARMSISSTTTHSTLRRPLPDFYPRTYDLAIPRSEGGGQTGMADWNGSLSTEGSEGKKKVVHSFCLDNLPQEAS